MIDLVTRLNTYADERDNVGGCEPQITEDLRSAANEIEKRGAEIDRLNAVIQDSKESEPVLFEQLRNIRSERDKLRSALEQYASLVFDLKIERDGMLDLVTDAQPHVCSLLCPSTWKTAEGRPPHHPTCVALSKARGAPPTETPKERR